MHLFAAQPGGFTDDAGIVDLAQTPAELVILSAADSVLSLLTSVIEHDSDFHSPSHSTSHSTSHSPSHRASVRLANWMNLVKPAAFDLYRDRVLDATGDQAPRGTQVVVLSLLGGASYWRYGLEQLGEWAEATGRTLIVVPGEDYEDESLLSAGTVERDDAWRTWRYLREGGAENARNLLAWLNDRFLDRPQPWREPRVLPRVSLYQPTRLLGDRPGGPESDRSQESHLQESHSQENRSQERGGASLAAWRQRWQAGRPVAALVFYRSHLQQGNTAVFDDLIETLEAGGLNVLPVAVASLKERLCFETLDALIEESGAAIMLNTTSFALAGSDRARAAPASALARYVHPWSREIPILQLIMAGTTVEDWLAQPKGLRPRDIAMHVALPELDGRIITRPVAFKSAHYRSSLCQHDVVVYRLNAERARFVAELAWRWAALAGKANADKRVALVLANYPSSDARIGNGVGLDTPASTLAILERLRDEGYPVGDPLPFDPTALIEWLGASVTNDTDGYDTRPAAQSLSLATYRRLFEALPEASKRAVTERWGAPESDPLHRDGRLMIAGMRLGDTFVGVQPARGFGIDQGAAYHDPDIPPTHGYLAFYFWLRHVYRVDAFVHVGKHGNLEWLPGKGVALTQACWPDIALGPMPHLYPFIVNDPGEGAQAKRRSQAVIIDHLMPPMTRAGIHGDLAELERLTDEYYQAEGLDERRSRFLIEAIIERVKSSHVLDELRLSPSAQGPERRARRADDERESDAVKSDEDETDDRRLLEELDNYLCDIKEAQIRGGLHVLGRLPEGASLRDTLISLVRLPRGSTAQAQGLIHALAQDLDLYRHHPDFDVLGSEATAWQGPRPELLAALDERAWRTSAQTRERLELLACALVEAYVMERPAMAGTATTGLAVSESEAHARHPTPPGAQSAAVLDFMRDTLMPLLHESVESELSMLVRGLAGGFVPPGASGAPSRGRLDTLPTGRNFYSVDSRAMPTPTAWTLGQKSAEALVMRHLQEHGDYPRSIGISAWGTATMRTGGDDIAQAFALMGVRPLWASGSQRLIDFEVIPAFLLGRPRVDVTLRISGFFRDAFPNLVDLFDSAVRKLAELNEPGDANTIAANVEARRETLIAAGASAEHAEREASFRIFGARPGAYGAGVQKLLDSGRWESEADLADTWIDWGSYAYGKHVEGESAPGALRERLSTLEAVVQNQDNREHDILDSGDYSQFQGGMSVAARQQGATPALYFGDHANPASPRMRSLREEISRVMRARVTNPKWIHAMQRHGYKGAFEMAASVDYLFAWGATTDQVSDYQYAQLCDALVFDPDNRRFLDDHNPRALKEMGEKLLEAIERDIWHAPGEYEPRLRSLLLSLDEREELAS